MNYQDFSALYNALCISESEVISVEAKGAIELAKKKIRVTFDKLFPNSLSDVAKRSSFNSKVFFGIIAKYPELLENNIEKFLHFLAALGKAQKFNPCDTYEITLDAVVVLNSKLIEDYVWEGSNGRKEVVLAEAIEAVAPVMRVYSENPEVKIFNEKIASWLLGYPHITEYMAQAVCTGSENWL